MRCINIKFISFFICSFLLLVLFWYYLGCFCAVYKNSQFALFKNTLISFSFSLLISFLFNLIPGIFRIHALRAHNKDKEFIYKLSKIIQLI